MRRKVFDVLVSAGGLLVVAVLVVSGALLMWAQSFTNSSVHNQLAQQDIFFPGKAGITPAERPYLLQYAGQQVLTGEHLLAGVLEEVGPLRWGDAGLAREENVLLSQLVVHTRIREALRPHQQRS
jgi:hypothetical protein